MKNLPLTAAILHFSLIMSASCETQQPGVERIWTGMNGKTFLGVFARTFDEGEKKAEFINSSGKVVTVAFENLSEKDRELIMVFEGKAPAQALPAAASKDAFKDLPNADRKKIPPMESDEVGATEYESIVDAVWVSLLWWDSEGIMPVPKSGDFDRKSEWLHKELTRYITERGDETASLQQTKDGLSEYFEKRLEETGSFKAQIQYNVDVESLSRLTVGNTILVLKMTMTYSDSKAYSTAAALESMAADGTFVMHMFGRRLTGKMTAAPAKKGTGNGAKVFNLIVSNPEVIPEYYKQNGAKFSIGDRDWNGVLLVDPFVYKTPGKKAPIPE